MRTGEVSVIPYPCTSWPPVPVLKASTVVRASFMAPETQVRMSPTPAFLDSGAAASCW